MENVTTDYVNQPTAAKKSKLSVIIIVTVIIVIIIGGFFLFFKKSKPSAKSQVAAAVTEAPTPTPTPAIDKQSVTIQVLNGTGTPGQAGKVVAALKKPVIFYFSSLSEIPNL